MMVDEEVAAAIMNSLAVPLATQAVASNRRAGPGGAANGARDTPVRLRSNPKN